MHINESSAYAWMRETETPLRNVTINTPLHRITGLHNMHIQTDAAAQAPSRSASGLLLLHVHGRVSSARAPSTPCLHSALSVLRINTACAPRRGRSVCAVRFSRAGAAKCLLGGKHLVASQRASPSSSSRGFFKNLRQTKRPAAWSGVGTQRQQQQGTLHCV